MKLVPFTFLPSLVSLILFLSIFSSCNSFFKPQKKFYANYYGHCDQVQSLMQNNKMDLPTPTKDLLIGSNDNSKQTEQKQLIHNLRTLLKEDSCRMKRIFLELATLCPKNSLPLKNDGSLKEWEAFLCYKDIFSDIIENYPASPTASIDALAMAGQFFLKNKETPVDQKIQMMIGISFLSLKSLSSNLSYANQVEKWPTTPLEKIPSDQWKSFHPDNQMSEDENNNKALTPDILKQKNMDLANRYQLFEYFLTNNTAQTLLLKIRQTLEILSTGESATPLVVKKFIKAWKDDYLKMRDYYLKRFDLSCEASFTEGCNQVGELFLEKEMKTEARSRWERSCSLLDGSGCSLVGLWYQNFEPENKQKIYQNYSMACLYGNTSGCNVVGIKERREGNLKKSKELFQTACSLNSKEKQTGQGEIDSAYKLACLLEKAVKQEKSSELTDILKGHFLEGTWQGHYMCPQGPTNLKLILKKSNKANFHFSFIKDKEQYEGIYEGMIKVEQGKIIFTPDSKEISQKIKGKLNGWLTVGFTANIFKKDLIGEINHEGCGELHLKKLN